MSPPTARIVTLGVSVDALDLEGATALLVTWLRECGDTPRPACRTVVTPNLDHAVQLRTNPALRAAYDAAALVVADGMPLVWASRLLGTPLPERVTGSDLTPRLLTAAPAGTRVYLLGASEDASLRAAAEIGARYRQLEVVGRLSPPRGFEQSSDWSERIVDDINRSGATLVIIGLGAPKQELWAHAHAARLCGTVVLCAGATLDFFAGTVRRAPKWIQYAGLEWLYRLVREPSRLARRYGKDALYLPLLLLADLRRRDRTRRPPSR